MISRRLSISRTFVSARNFARASRKRPCKKSSASNDRTDCSTRFTACFSLGILFRALKPRSEPSYAVVSRITFQVRRRILPQSPVQGEILCRIQFHVQVRARAPGLCQTLSPPLMPGQLRYCGKHQSIFLRQVCDALQPVAPAGSSKLLFEKQNAVERSIQVIHRSPQRCALWPAPLRFCAGALGVWGPIMNEAYRFRVDQTLRKSWPQERAASEELTSVSSDGAP